jgi:hypothetical protein
MHHAEAGDRHDPFFTPVSRPVCYSGALGGRGDRAVYRTAHQRALDGTEIDGLISDLQARKGLAIERVRRKRWQRVIENAAAFKLA